MKENGECAAYVCLFALYVCVRGDETSSEERHFINTHHTMIHVTHKVK